MRIYLIYICLTAHNAALLTNFAENGIIAAENKKETNFMERNYGESEFNGGLLGLIGIKILQTIIITFTLGIAAPWAVCMKENWIARHTRIDGRQVIFDGTGGQLFGNYIKWFLLTIITVGIYGFWLDIKMKKWVVKHTHLA